MATAELTKAARRRRDRRRRLLALPACLLVAGGCAWPSPERQLLLDFFQACRLYDLTVAERLADIPCNPKTDGAVSEFELIEVERVSATERRVDIQATVRMFDGSESRESMTVNLTRREGRWRVAAITPPRASQTSPAASSVPPN